MKHLYLAESRLGLNPLVRGVIAPPRMVSGSVDITF